MEEINWTEREKNWQSWQMARIFHMKESTNVINTMHHMPIPDRNIKTFYCFKDKSTEYWNLIFINHNFWFFD